MHIHHVYTSTGCVACAHVPDHACVCAFMHTSIIMYEHIYVPVVCVGVYVYHYICIKCVCMNMDVLGIQHVCAHLHTPLHVSACTHICVQGCMHVQVCTHTYVSMCLYV